MRFGIIEYNSSGEFSVITGVASRRNVSVNRSDALIRTNPSALENIYLVAHLPRTIVHTVNLTAPLTGRNLEAALQFELEHLLPIPPENVLWGYRRLSRNNRKYRIFAVHREELQKLFDSFATSGLVCDAFLPAQLLLDTGETPADTTPAQLMLDYLPTDPAGRNLHPGNDIVPRELRPVRHRWWRMGYQVVLTAALLLAASVLVVRYLTFAEEYGKLRAEHQRMEEKLQEIRTISRQLDASAELYQKITDIKLGTASVLPILADLNKRLPSYMYITGYVQNGDMADVTILSDRDDSNLSRLLLDSPLYQSDLRKTVQPKNTTFFVTLRSLTP